MKSFAATRLCWKPSPWSPAPNPGLSDRLAPSRYTAYNVVIDDKRVTADKQGSTSSEDQHGTPQQHR